MAVEWTVVEWIEVNEVIMEIIVVSEKTLVIVEWIVVIEVIEVEVAT